MSEKRQIFISYSRKDNRWLERLKTFLRPLEREAELQAWSDTDIKPSSNWHADIQKALHESDAAILLISQDFLASDYIANNELPQLLSAANERGLRIFPVIVSSAYLKDSPLMKFQAVNAPTSPLDTLDRAKQNIILTRLTESVADLIKVVRSGVTEEWLEKFRSRFIPIEGGTYIAGDNDLHNQLHAREEHEVKVDSFHLGKYVVTQAEWIALMNTQPWLDQRNVKLGDDVPAVYVSWHDAVDFIRAINKADSKFAYRLPTEAEWEYAARGGKRTLNSSRTRFSFGDDANKMIEYGWHDRNASQRGDNYAHPVGGLRGNPLGLFDMHGNIWEWASDDIEGLRALRGGGFNFMADGGSSAFRVVNKPETKGEAAGFRLVQEAR